MFRRALAGVGLLAAFSLGCLDYEKPNPEPEPEPTPEQPAPESDPGDWTDAGAFAICPVTPGAACGELASFYVIDTSRGLMVFSEQ